MASEIQQWCNNNKLTAYLDRIEATMIAQCPFTGPVKPLYFGGNQIKIATTTQSFGVKIDNRLTWNEQFRKVTKLFSIKLSQLKRMKYLPRQVLEEIYKSIISNVTWYTSLGNKFIVATTRFRTLPSTSGKDGIQYYAKRSYRRTYIRKGKLETT